MSALVEVVDRNGRHYMPRSNPRRGASLTCKERTLAVLRVVVDGEDSAAVAADVRVSRGTLGQWTKQWRRREGQWRDDELSAAERLRGCRLAEDGHGKTIAEVGPLPTGAELTRLTAERDVEARAWFVAQLEAADCDEDVLLRAWRDLSERDQGELTPAWDAYRELVEQLAAGRQRVQAAIGAAVSLAGETGATP